METGSCLMKSFRSLYVYDKCMYIYIYIILYISYSKFKRYVLYVVIHFAVTFVSAVFWLVALAVGLESTAKDLKLIRFFGQAHHAFASTPISQALGLNWLLSCILVWIFGSEVVKSTCNAFYCLLYHRRAQHRSTLGYSRLREKFPFRKIAADEDDSEHAISSSKPSPWWRSSADWLGKPCELGASL